jgi:hypothetical protein
MPNATREESIENAIGECAFAKQVNTKDGPAILISGSVISVQTGISDDSFWVEVITRALRRGSRDAFKITSGDTANGR